MRTNKTIQKSILIEGKHPPTDTIPTYCKYAVFQDIMYSSSKELVAKPQYSTCNLGCTLSSVQKLQSQTAAQSISEKRRHQTHWPTIEGSTSLPIVGTTPKSAQIQNQQVGPAQPSNIMPSPLLPTVTPYLPLEGAVKATPQTRILILWRKHANHI